MAVTDQVDLVGIEIPFKIKVGSTVTIPVSITTRTNNVLSALGS